MAKLVTKSFNESLCSNNTTAACRDAAKLLSMNKLAILQQCLVGICCSRPELIRNSRFVQKLSLRLEICNDSRFKQDKLGLARVVADIVSTMTRAAPCRTPDVETVQFVVRGGSVDGLMRRYATDQVRKSILDLVEALKTQSMDVVKSVVTSIASLKSYPMQVHVPSVSHACSFDAMWLVWKVLVECIDVTPPSAEAYVNNLFYLSRCRFSKSNRIHRTSLLLSALSMLCSRRMASWDMTAPVVFEAIWKFCFLFQSEKAT
jgi:hypothetical protein